MISNGGCQHKCNNTEGSFNCSCHNGFYLADDLRTCEGKKVLKCFFLIYVKTLSEGSQKILFFPEFKVLLIKVCNNRKSCCG